MKKNVTEQGQNQKKVSYLLAKKWEMCNFAAQKAENIFPMYATDICIL